MWTMNPEMELKAMYLENTNADSACNQRYYIKYIGKKKEGKEKEIFMCQTHSHTHYLAGIRNTLFSVLSAYIEEESSVRL